MKRIQQTKRALIERLLICAPEEAAGLGSEAVKLFLRRFFESMAVEDLETLSQETLSAETSCAPGLALLELASHREPGRAKLRLLNPETERDGWSSVHTVIQVVNDDMPFLVDSLAGELARREITIHRVSHPQFAVQRSPSGRLSGFLDGVAESEPEQRESTMHLEIDQQTSPAALAELEAGCRRVLEDVRTAVTDYPKMRETLRTVLAEMESNPPPVPEEELAETLSFLRWVDDNNFTYLGYRRYALDHRDGRYLLRPLEETGLGLRRRLSAETRVAGHRPLNAPAMRFLKSERVVLISKSNYRATVHRSVHMDVLSLKRFDETGRVVAEERFIGLFTSRAYTIAVHNIPLIERKVRRVVERAGFLPASHDAKLLRHLIESYPRDELLQVSEEDLYHFSMRLLELQLRPRMALLVRLEELQRFVTCMVYVPREQHNTDLRLRMQHILEEAYQGEVSSFSTRVSELPLAQVMFTLKTIPGEIPDVNPREVEARLAEAARSWSDRLRVALVQVHGEETGLALYRRYGRAFPPSYQEHISAEATVVDIELLSRVLASHRLGLRLYRRPNSAPNRVRLRTFELDAPAALSRYLPILENMGLQVESEIPFEVRPHGEGRTIWVRDFELISTGPEIDPERAAEPFQETFVRVCNEEVENDSFNRLVLWAGLSWRQVVLLRALHKYLRQARMVFSAGYVAGTLARNPEITMALVRLFEQTFDPDSQEQAEQRCGELLEEIRHGLEHVHSLEEDRILRRLLGLIQATLRTNYFQTEVGEDGAAVPKPYLSLKLDARSLPELPEPRPAYEIFVYSPRVEAVHLRAGKVARGGIRWSDRREDFRTEILGLVKAQIVKNAVIVPMGAKGGFVVKRPPTGQDREAFLAEGIECYKTMMRGLLDLTDNRDGQEVLPPPRVVRRDEDDPYLVVAADKGTASFSDIANGVAADYGFWLGDAFASGGSAGYDHKKMGITARGAWESVKRHFRERGKDIQNESFSVIGVGDMSGDVFGNGMLLSEHTRLVGAFNHLHIFLDPDPDPATSFQERKRLFELPRSTWADYDPQLLSPGGAVFPRASKALEVSQEVQQLLGLGQDSLTPNELIQAMLRCQVDLLWFGGIGTYVKSSSESHADADDRANDDLRVDAKEVGAKVVGEGANLGVTQRGRIEYSLSGGRINTDFIDNSGGVDTSDHEVNIKIALDEAVAARDITGAERDQLLEEMTEEVSALVLRDNYLQSQAITQTFSQGAAALDKQQQLMRRLERVVELDRRLEFLPDDTALAERRAQGVGLTRPEVAVLLAYAKIDVYQSLLQSDLPDDPLLVSDLLHYFPEALRKPFRAAIERHRLRREIIATDVTNSMINRVGPTFVQRMMTDTGREVADVARAYTAARDAFQVRDLWTRIEALDNKVSSEIQADLYMHINRLVDRMTRWFLRYGGWPLDVSARVAEYRAALEGVAAELEKLLAANARAMIRRRRQRLEKLGVEKKLAQRIAGLDFLASGGDVVRCSRLSGKELPVVGRLYFAIGERFGLDRIRRAVTQVRSADRFQRQALGNLSFDLFHHQAELTLKALGQEGKRPRRAMEALLAAQPAAVARLDHLLEDLRPKSRPQLALLLNLEREVRRLAGDW